MTKNLSANRRKILAGLIAVPFIPRRARADDFPSRPIRLVVPFGAGSVADIVGRKVADKAGQLLKTTFVVENRPGAGGGNRGAGRRNGCT